MFLSKELDVINIKENNLLKCSFIGKFPISNKHKKLFAFTLAEILITLLIIGVVASLTIPNLIADTHEQELKVAWKRTYSDLDQATRKIMMDNGGTMKGLSFTGDSSNFIKNKFGEYLTYIRSCNNEGAYGKCWSYASTYKNGSTTPYSTPEDLALYTFANDAGAILKNGVFVQFVGGLVNSYKSDCPSNICGSIYVDVNGNKGPNVCGVDIFGVVITPNGIKPFGTKGDSYQNTCSDSSTGWGCSAEYLYQ